ncbi:MAG: hypothetical protein ACLTVB_02945 [Sutterella sp.]
MAASAQLPASRLFREHELSVHGAVCAFLSGRRSAFAGTASFTSELSSAAFASSRAAFQRLHVEAFFRFARKLLSSGAISAAINGFPSHQLRVLHEHASAADFTGSNESTLAAVAPRVLSDQKSAVGLVSSLTKTFKSEFYHFRSIVGFTVPGP